ncbi:MAG: stretch-activated cation channel mid1 [Alyxoria varia]|nr:MAG: stretch-activated cation channel mid1 [Alyxoria varia]
MSTASQKRNSTSSKSPKSSSEKRRPLHERSDSQTNRSSIGGASALSEDSIYQKDPFPRLPSQVLPPKGIPLIFEDPATSGENAPPEQEGLEAELDEPAEQMPWPLRGKGKEKAPASSDPANVPTDDSQSHLTKPVFHHGRDERPGPSGPRPPASIADRFKQRQLKRGSHPLRSSPTEVVSWSDPWQPKTPETPERSTRLEPSGLDDTPMTSGAAETPPKLRQPSIASRISRADSASQWESIADTERPRSSSNPEISTDAFLRDLIANGENVGYARLQKQSIPSLRSQSSSTRMAMPQPLRLHRKHGQSNLALRAANAADDNGERALSHQQRWSNQRMSGNWADEMQDMVPELGPVQRRLSLQHRDSTNGRRSNSISSTHSSIASRFYNLENDSRTAWASYYYRSNEGALRLTTPPSITNMRSMSSLRDRPLTPLTHQRSASISGPSTSPDSTGFPDDIYIPRARPLMRQTSSLIGEPGPVASSESMVTEQPSAEGTRSMTTEPSSAARSQSAAIERPSAEERDSMAIQPAPEPHMNALEDQHRPQAQEYDPSTIRWSHPLNQAASVPGLSVDRRSSQLISVWPAPSVEGVEGLDGVVNRQIALFCLGFFFPFANRDFSYPLSSQLNHAQDGNHHNSRHILEDYGDDDSLVVRADPPRRQDIQVEQMVNNRKDNLNIQPGSTTWYNFKASPTSSPDKRDALWTDGDASTHEHDLVEQQGHGPKDSGLDSPLDKRQRNQGQTKRIFITINVCLQPTFRSREDSREPPQLTLHAQRQDPRRTSDDSPPGSRTVPLVEGYGRIDISADDAVFVRVSAPRSRLKEDSQDWNYDIAASTRAPYHELKDEAEFGLYMIDSDSSAALLVTNGLTDWVKREHDTDDPEKFLEKGPPLDLFVNNINETAVRGLSRSYCALSQIPTVLSNAQSSVNPESPFEIGITHNQPGGLAEEQFYVPSLNRTTTYIGRPATLNAGSYGDNVPNGGGTLYPSMNFTTKRDANCAVIYNLTFCHEVNYAVPANPERGYNSTKLRDLYDNQAARLFKNFTYSLQQIPCNTTPTAQYSLAAGCKNCSDAYKTWLCTVSIPKCADFSRYSRKANLVKFLGNGTESPFSSSEQDEDDEEDGSAAPAGEGDALSGFDPNSASVPGTSYLMPRNLAQKPLGDANIPSVFHNSGGTGNASMTAKPSHLQWLATNSSRMNDTIAGEIQPGPYMEVLPCEDLCYDLVRMCPAKLGFQCPRPGSLGMRASYGQRGYADGGAYMCSAPGVLYYKSKAGRLSLERWWMWVWVGLAGLVFAVVL